VWDVTSSTASAVAATDAYVYDAFGNVEAHSGYLNTPYMYAGEYGYYGSSITGLYLLQARYYDPAVGRFVSADPIGYKGGFNLYMYVSDNPVQLVDPQGLSPRSDCLKDVDEWEKAGQKLIDDNYACNLRRVDLVCAVECAPLLLAGREPRRPGEEPGRGHGIGISPYTMCLGLCAMEGRLFAQAGRALLEWKLDQRVREKKKACMELPN
jgi:RHS repeat-associated protein